MFFVKLYNRKKHASVLISFLVKGSTWIRFDQFYFFCSLSEQKG